MANPSTAHEPSMEEILASIRQIISEDGDAASTQKAEGAQRTEGAGKEASGSPAREPEPQRDAYETVVSRLESASASEAAPNNASRPMHEEKAKRQGATTVSEPLEDDYQAPAPQRPMSVARRPLQQEEDNALLSPEKGAAVSGAFGALAHTLLAQNSRTLEDVVAEMLQPMLKSWLDDNLPSLVERMVQEEIERVSRGRR
jgi:cell pole-organizing protein PopZ